MNTKTPAKFSHLISDERWGETCLVDDVDKFIGDMQESMFGGLEAAQKLAELHELAAERDEVCEDTEESIRNDWRAELRSALQPVEAVALADGRTGYMTVREAVYVETANGLASYAGEWADLKLDDEIPED